MRLSAGGVFLQCCHTLCVRQRDTCGYAQKTNIKIVEFAYFSKTNKIVEKPIQNR